MCVTSHVCHLSVYVITSDVHTTMVLVIFVQSGTLSVSYCVQNWRDEWNVDIIAYEDLYITAVIIESLKCGFVSNVRWSVSLTE